MDSIFADFMASPAGMAASAVIAVALVEFGTGVLKAIAAGQFQLTLVDTWIRKTVAGRVIPILLLLLGGALLPDVSVLGIQADFLTATGMTAAAAFGVAGAASIVDNVNPKATDTPPTG